MGVEMNLGQSDHQAQGVTAVLSNRLSAYETIRSSLQTFIGTSNLQGHAYQSAKDYSSQVLIPLLKGCILLDEAIKEACAKLPSEYRSRVDVISLKESDLNDNIDRAQSMINSYQDLIDWEYCREEPDYHYISNLRGLRNSYQELRVELTLKRDKLVSFSGSSPSLFSDIHSLLEAVQQGLRQASLSWNSKTGTFKISDEVGMAWADGLNRPWQNRATTRAQTLIERVEKGEDLNSDELNELGRYLVDNPKSKLYDKGMSAFLKSLKVEVGGVDELISFIKGTYGDNLEEGTLNITGSSIDEIKDVFIEKILLKISQSAPAIGNSTSKALSRANIIGALMIMLSSAPDNLKNVMYNVIEKVGGTTAISSIKMGNLFGQLSTPTSGFISKLGFDTYASIGLGSIAAVADAWGQVGEGENVINATTKGVAHTVMATSIIRSTTSAGATLGATIGSVFPGPGTAIGGAAGAAIGFVAGVAISMGADKVFDTVYDNTVGKIVDWAMDNPVGASINHAATEFVTNTNKAIGNAVDSTVSDIKNTVKDIGNAVGGWFNGLGSVFG